MIIKRNSNIAFINKRKYNIRICVKKLENEIKDKIEKEIENNDLIKINLCSKKGKVNIKKRYNNLIFFTFFYDIEFSRIRCLCLLIDIVLFDLRKSAIIEFFHIFLIRLISL